jgi:SAM-dependent methyltransferase
MKKKYVAAVLTCVVLIFSYAQELQVTSCFSIGAEFWDLDKPLPYIPEYSLFRSYVQEAKGNILEPMCGAGRYLVPLYEEGFKIDGLDASPFMIDILRKKCIKKNIAPHIVEQFLELMPETKKYSLIFIPDTSICFFNDLDQVKKNLKKIYSLLERGGKFVFDIQTQYARWGEIGVWTGRAHRNKRGDMIIESSLPLEIKDSISTLLLRYEIMRDNKIIKTEMETYSARLYGPMQMDKLLKEVGFKRIKKIKAYDRKSAPGEKDPTIVYECRK